MHKRGLACWEQGPSLRLPGLWMEQNRAFSSQRPKRSSTDGPRVQLEAELRTAEEVLITKASSVLNHKNLVYTLFTSCQNLQA